MNSKSFRGHRPPRAARSALVLAVCLLSGAALAAAPDADGVIAPQAPQPAESLDNPVGEPVGDPVSDAKLRQFAVAASNVQAIQQEYVVRAESLKDETEEKIMDSVQGAGMTVDEFRTIFQQVQADPTLAQRLDQLITQ